MKSRTRSRQAGGHTSTATEGRLLGSLHQVWLAGLGAVAKAQTEGPKVRNELIKEGALVQGRNRTAAKKAVRSTIGDVRAFVRRIVNELPPVRVLEEIRALRKQVDAMNANIEKLAHIRRAPAARRAKTSR